MKAIAKLKDDARKFEQKEEWEKAIQAYLQVLKLGEQGDGAEVDLPLYNRVGDLFVRLGRPMDAVTYYEQAADRYADAGLYNNAIALCNKALRYDSARLELLKKLGSFSASQGFFTDARRYYLEYAEKSIKRGSLDEAFDALSDYANVNEEADVRELLARQLREHGRNDRALEEFKRAYTLRTGAGEQAEADKIRAEIRALDPSAEVSIGNAQTSQQSHGYQVAEQLPGFVDAEPAPPATFEPESPEPEPEPLNIESSAAPGAMDATVEDSRFGTIDLDGFGSAEPMEPRQMEPLDIGIEKPLSAEDETEDRLGSRIDLGSLEVEKADDYGAEALAEAPEPLPTFDEFEASGESFTDLPMLGGDEVGVEPLPGFDVPGAFEDIGLEATEFSDVAPLDVGELEKEETGLAGAPLPMLDDAAVEEAVEALPGFEDEWPPFDGMPAAEPAAEPAEIESPAAALSERGEEVAAEELEEGETEPDETDYEELPSLEEPEEVELPGFEDEPMEEDLPPAAAWAADESTEDAAAVTVPPAQTSSYQPPPAPAPPPTELPRTPRSDYVDLAALLGDDEEEAEDSTRFVVAEQPPTGDEEKDFADMLKQFKSKVAESIPLEDAGSHYDLGIAFKEMGLVDEAIGEFQTALRAGQHKLKVYEELGSCFVMKQQYSVAITILNRAQHMEHNDDHELLGVYYSLGRAHEELGQRAEAKDAYEKIVAIDIGFQDTTARLARL